MLNNLNETKCPLCLGSACVLQNGQFEKCEKCGGKGKIFSYVVSKEDSDSENLSPTQSYEYKEQYWQKLLHELEERVSKLSKDVEQLKMTVATNKAAEGDLKQEKQEAYKGEDTVTQRHYWGDRFNLEDAEVQKMVGTVTNANDFQHLSLGAEVILPKLKEKEDEGAASAVKECEENLKKEIAERESQIQSESEGEILIDYDGSHRSDERYIPAFCQEDEVLMHPDDRRAIKVLRQAEHDEQIKKKRGRPKRSEASGEDV